MTTYDEGTINNLLTQIAELRSTVASLQTRDASARDAAELVPDLGDLPYYGYDADNGKLRIVISPTDLFDQFGVHANIVGLDDNGIVQIYVSCIDGKLYAGGGAVVLDRNGLTLSNGAYTDDEASVNMYEIGWLLNQLAEASGQTRAFKVGMRDNGANPEAVLQHFEPSTALTIPNHNFDTLDLSDWDEVQKGYALAALGTLSTSFGVQAIAIDGTGNLYAGGSGFTTSVVWKYDVGAGTWAALGTLMPTGSPVVKVLAFDGSGNLYATGDAMSGGVGGSVQKWNGSTWTNVGTYTAFQIRAMILDSSNNIYISGSTTTSSVWKWNGTTWAALGTLNTIFTVNSFVFDGSGNLYAGISSSATTSSVWKWNGTTWAALGTLATGFDPQNLVVDSSNNIYAGAGLNSSGVTTSSMWKWNGSTWAALGTLDTTFKIGSLVIDSFGNLYAGRITGAWTTSSLWKWNGYEWLPFGTFATNRNIYDIVIDADGNIYVGGISNYATSSVWKYTASDWDASTGLATVVSSEASPEIRSAARIAVTTGDVLEFTADTIGEVTGGTLGMSIRANFYTASSGGTFVSSLNVFTRTLTADGILLEMSDTVIVPETATHMEIVCRVSSTSGVQVTAQFDNIRCSITNALIEFILDDKAYLKKQGVKTTLVQALKKMTSSLPTINPASPGTVTVFDIPIPPQFLSGENGLRFWASLFVDTNAGARNLTYNLYYDNTLVITTGTKTHSGSSVSEEVLHGELLSTGTNTQRGILRWRYTIGGGGGSTDEQVFKGTATEDVSTPKNLKLEIVVSGTLDSMVLYDVVIELLENPA